MIQKIFTVHASSNNPYYNLALEEYLLHSLPKDSCILFLWQNRSCVVVGKNQNCWKECNVDLIQQKNSFIARRLSGGGAVYHDFGNLNFTFLTSKLDIDISLNFTILLKALELAGVPAQLSGRNDIVSNGKKISGSAFFNGNVGAYHHGTLLVNTNIDDLSDFLTPSAEKLAPHGVSSVRSRVANISEANHTITVEKMKELICTAFADCYNLEPQKMLVPSEQKLETLINKYSTWEWIFGREMPFTAEICGDFSWGNLQIRLEIHRARVRDIEVFSDSLDGNFATVIAKCLIGKRFLKPVFLEAIQNCNYYDTEVIKGVCDMIEKSDI